MTNFLNGHRVLYAVPVSDQLERFWKEVTWSLGAPLEAGLFYKNETEHIIEKQKTDQRIRAKTAFNADTLRGDYADILILDEWQLMNESAWEEVGAPMLLDNNGEAIFIYTPPSLHARSRGSVTKARDPRHAAKMFKRAKEDATGRWQAFHWTSHDNPRLSREALEDITLDMTSIALRQEIMAEDIEEIAGALWKMKMLDETRVTIAPDMARIVVGVDPTGSTRNEAGIVVAGLGRDGHGYVLKDSSTLGTPEQWSRIATDEFQDWQANSIVAEVNFGGDMVESTIKTSDSSVHVKLVRASRGKLVRAEPVAALYERGRIHHVGNFPKLEEEMVSYVPGNPSPNRMDALTWAISELMVSVSGSSSDAFLASSAKPVFSNFKNMVL